MFTDASQSGLSLWFILHARIFEDISPLPAGACVAMLQMLPEMIRAVELLGIVAFPELVHARQMLKSAVPVGLREIREVFAAVSASIMGGTRTGLGRW